MAEHIIRLVGEINEENISEVIEKFSRIPRNAEKVVLMIDSDGGSIEEGFRLIDAIRILQNKGVCVHAVVIGKAYSMAAFIMCAANERTAYTNARLMVHCARYDGLGENDIYTAEDLRILMHEMEYYDRLMTDLLISAGVSPHDAELLMGKKDSYLNVQQAIHIGLIHKEEYELI